MSSNDTISAAAPQQQQDDAAAAGGAAQDKQQPQETVTKTVQTVEVRSSAGQADDEGVLKPVRVVHEIPAKDAKADPGVKQD